MTNNIRFALSKLPLHGIPNDKALLYLLYGFDENAYNTGDYMTATPKPRQLTDEIM